jgi:uncharacterized protein YjdB
MVIALFAALSLTGCGAPAPASITFDGTQAAVHDLTAVPALKASAVDAEGKALEPQPELTWSVDPVDTVVKLEAGNITPVANGTAHITATVGEVKASYDFVVALPDKVEIAGVTAGTPVPAGTTLPLTATVKSGETAIADAKVKWSSDNEAFAKVDEAGVVTAVAEGKANIKAEFGAQSATAEVTVGAAAAATTDAAAAPK